MFEIFLSEVKNDRFFKDTPGVMTHVQTTSSSKPAEPLQQVSTPSQPSTTPQTLRPAAAVAPIMQPGSTTSTISDTVLGMTNVTSLSYSCPVSEDKTQTVREFVPFGQHFDLEGSKSSADDGDSSRKV